MRTIQQNVKQAGSWFNRAELSNLRTALYLLHRVRPEEGKTFTTDIHGLNVWFTKDKISILDRQMEVFSYASESGTICFEPHALSSKARKVDYQMSLFVLTIIHQVTMLVSGVSERVFREQLSEPNRRRARDVYKLLLSVCDLNSKLITNNCKDIIEKRGDSITVYNSQTGTSYGTFLPDWGYAGLWYNLVADRDQDEEFKSVVEHIRKIALELREINDGYVKVTTKVLRGLFSGVERLTGLFQKESRKLGGYIEFPAKFQYVSETGTRVLFEPNMITYEVNYGNCHFGVVTLDRHKSKAKVDKAVAVFYNDEPKWDFKFNEDCLNAMTEYARHVATKLDQRAVANEAERTGLSPERISELYQVFLVKGTRFNGSFSDFVELSKLILKD